MNHADPVGLLLQLVETIKELMGRQDSPDLHDAVQKFVLLRVAIGLGGQVIGHCLYNTAFRKLQSKHAHVQISFFVAHIGTHGDVGSVPAPLNGDRHSLQGQSHRSPGLFNLQLHLFQMGNL